MEVGDGEVAREAIECISAVHEALWFLALAMFNTLHSLIRSSHVYILNKEKLEDCLEGSRCRLERGRLAGVFRKVRLRLMKALGVILLGVAILRWLRLTKRGRFEQGGGICYIEECL